MTRLNDLKPKVRDAKVSEIPSFVLGKCQRAHRFGPMLPVSLS